MKLEILGSGGAVTTPKPFCDCAVCQLAYYLGLGIVDLSVVADDESFELNGYMIRPIKLAIDYVFGYDIRSSSTRILVIMDELKGWQPSEVIAGTPYDTMMVEL